jgi:hypothetical protein
MVHKRAQKTKPRGRPIDPDSLRQSGVMLRCRLPADLFADASHAAEPIGGLSSVVRMLLEAWLKTGKGK